MVNIGTKLAAAVATVVLIAGTAAEKIVWIPFPGAVSHHMLAVKTGRFVAPCSPVETTACQVRRDISPPPRPR